MCSPRDGTDFLNYSGEGMEHILSLSYGKDSIACLFAIEKLGWQLDRIIHAEVWATDTISAELPHMVEFKVYTDEFIKVRWGITVEHVCATNIDGERKDKVTYQDGFYHVIQNGEFKGAIKGFPLMYKGSWCKKLKINPFDLCVKNGESFVRYLGIAADEPKRIEKHKNKPNVRLPLVELGWTEAYCRKLCEDNGLLSPIYTTSARGGCWFCHNQPVQQLRLLRKNYPEYWALLLKWDSDSPVSFKADGHTVHDYERRFAAEDEGFIYPEERFYWASLDSLQYRFF